MYVIQLTEFNGRYPGGYFVTRSGASDSYTKFLQNARTFATWDAANAQRCPGNERVIAVADLMGAQS